MRLEGKTAIITGAASGFGAGMARVFSREGASVLVADLNEDAAVAIADEIGGAAIRTDVSKGADVAAMTQAAMDQWGRIDILVNNAGITHLPTPLEDVSEDDFDRIFAVNAKSVYLTAREIVPLMKATGSGAILNIASTAGLSPRPNLNWYNASKGWMITATKTMAVELASAGIRVNALCPVAGETPLLASFMGEDTPEIRAKFLSTIPLGRFSQPEDMGEDTPEIRAKFLSTIPLGRFSQPEDMGEAAAFLCSDAASMITGTALEVDGGRCI